MKLRKLILSGFKSFADKTEFEFDDGISCIVGPNGCGKSNVVDAIKWVLGEQSAKSLRGSEMMDVIFNGSSARRASGCAEVTLVFENDDGILKPPESCVNDKNGEIWVTRRLFRSGQSEYLINKHTARLKDIKEMFLDTGIGVHAYGVIEQGHVEVFLQASHDERRAIFDEAAGISRYKTRKKEALRKLDRVEQNLLRLTDVLGEVERRLRSIKYQAGKARNYQTYTEQLSGLKSLYFLSQYHILSEKRSEKQRQLDRGTDSASAMNTRIDQLGATYSGTEAEVEDLERSARDMRVQIATVGGQITTQQERVESYTERIEELKQQVVTLSARCEELEAKIESFEQQIEHRKGELEGVEEETASRAEQYEALQETYQAGEMDLSRLQADLEDEKNGTMDLIRRASQFHNEVQASKIRQDNLKNQRERLDKRAMEIDEALANLLTEHAQVETRTGEIEETLNATKARLEEANASNREAIENENEYQRELSEKREQRSALQSRAKALREMQNRLEGIGTGVRKVLQARKEGKLECIRGMLGDFVQADVELAPLIEAALGGSDQQLIAMRYDELRSTREELDEILGENASVEVWCMDRLDAWRDDFDATKLDGVIGRAIDYVQCESWVAPAVWNLLGKTLLTDTLDQAKSAAQKAPGDYRFVTRRGEVLEADGRVRIGWANRGAGVVTRRSELADLESQLQQMDERIEALQQQCQEARGQREHLEEVLQSLRTAVYEDSMELTSAKGRLEKLNEQIEQFKREQPVVSKDMEQLASEIENAVRSEHEAKEKAAELEELNEQRKEHIEALEQRIAEARSRQNEHAEQMTEMKVALGQAREKSLSLKESIASLERQHEQMQRDYSASREEIGMNRQRRDAAQTEIENAKDKIEELYKQHENLSTEVEEIEESQRGLKEKLEVVRQELNEQRKAQKQVDEQVSNLRVEISQYDTNISNLITRASDDLGMDLLEASEEYEHDDERDWDAVAAEIKELDAKIKRLGNVNLDAIAEQEELEKRHALYQEQIDDITESQSQLTELIKRINKESRQLFVETFEAVRANFQNLFRKLFGGGRADILLTNPEDVLDSGIEIMARPPGKETRSLSLLSGGEKTMTALSLLFSIFQAKPSPFCLLDEVDAALDEANTERFSHLLQEFVGESQFLVISHAKRTMSMAEVLYGVTMQEPGVSKRISVKFEEADKHLDEELQPA